CAFFLVSGTNVREALIQLRRRPWLWIPMLIGACVLIGFLYATREPGAASEPDASFGGWEYLKRNLRSYPLFLCFPLPLAAYWAAARWTNGPRRLAMVLAAAAAAGLLARDGRIILPVIGFSVLADLILEAWRKRDHQELFLALWLLVPLPIVFY